MRIALAAALSLCAVAAASALAAVTTTVVDLQRPNGVTQRFLYLRPDAPRANIVALPGGSGVLDIQADGAMSGVVADCFPVGRNRQAFADHGFAVALVDANSLGVVRDQADMTAVVRYLP